MPKGIMYVETRPSSADREAEYHEWYENHHIKEILGVDGFVSCRRFAPVDGDGPFTAIYEIEADDLVAAQQRLREAHERGDVSPPTSAVATDPPPTVRLLSLMSVHEA